MFLVLWPRLAGITLLPGLDWRIRSAIMTVLWARYWASLVRRVFEPDTRLRIRPLKGRQILTKLVTLRLATTPGRQSLPLLHPLPIGHLVGRSRICSRLRRR